MHAYINAWMHTVINTCIHTYLQSDIPSFIQSYIHAYIQAIHEQRQLVNKVNSTNHFEQSSLRAHLRAQIFVSKTQRKARRTTLSTWQTYAHAAKCSRVKQQRAAVRSNKSRLSTGFRVLKIVLLYMKRRRANSHHLSSAWARKRRASIVRCWKQRVVSQKTFRRIAHRGLLRCMRKSLLDAFATWKEGMLCARMALQQRLRCQTRVFALEQARLYFSRVALIDTWSLHTRTRRAVKKTIVAVILRMQRRCAACALQGWCDVQYVQGRRHVVKKHVRARQMSKVISSAVWIWWRVVSESKKEHRCTKHQHDGVYKLCSQIQRSKLYSLLTNWRHTVALHVQRRVRYQEIEALVSARSLLFCAASCCSRW